MTPPKKSPAVKKLTPKEARTVRQIKSLECNEARRGRAGILVAAGYVILYDGLSPVASSAILSRAAFEAFIRFYETGSTKKERA